MKTRIFSKTTTHAERKGRPKRGKRHARRHRAHEQQPVKFYTKEQVEELFTQIESIRDRLLFDLTYRHGLRRGEAVLLEVGDIQGDQIWIARLKGGEAHWHPLHPRTKQLLRAYLAVRPPDRCPYLFRGKRRSRQPLSEETINYLFRRYAAAAGHPTNLRHVHVLRHSIGVHLANAGWDIADVQWWLGHREIESTKVYFQVLPARIISKYRTLLRSHHLANTGSRIHPQRKLAPSGGGH